MDQEAESKSAAFAEESSNWSGMWREGKLDQEAESKSAAFDEESR